MDAALQGYSAAQALRTGGKDEVRAALVAARARTLLLMDAYSGALAATGYAIPYRETVNPPLWEWGHIAWFHEWWVGRNRERAKGIACDPVHVRLPSVMPRADELYDSSRIAHPRRWQLPLPDVRVTRGYLDATHQQCLELLDDAAEGELYFFKLVALHEEMHAEAACYMAEALGIEVPRGVLREMQPKDAARDTAQIPEQVFDAGWAGPGFAFDNELGPHRVKIGTCEIDAQPVSWDRFEAFIRDGGYRDRHWWDEEGWAWLSRRGNPGRAAHTPGGPAMHLTAFEAEAWCRWAGRRLPTEFEWECAALTQDGFRWGSTWEWTSSAFAPYPGFEPHPYRDYSQPWFGTRRVLRGAAPATSAALAHPRYRNFFEPHRDDVFAGFRSCAR